MLEYNQYKLLPIEVTQVEKEHVIVTHPDFQIGINSLPNKVDVFSKLEREYVTPTGLRTIELPPSLLTEQDHSRIVLKGYGCSPVHIYGPKAEAAVARKIKVTHKDGDFGKAADYDFIYEFRVLEQLRKFNPELIIDPNVPIWQLIGVGATGEEIIDVSEENPKLRKGLVVLRRFPYTHWRVADTFFDTASQNIESELIRLQSIWNVDSRAGVYVKAMKRLSQALSYMYNAHQLHGNLYWKWFDQELQRVYARPNPHNIGLDGSLGDFEIHDPLYGCNETDIDIRETLGAFSIYTLLIAERNPELLSSSEFVSKLIATFNDELPIQLYRRIPDSRQSQQIIEDYEMRLHLAKSGKKTMNGMEYFDDSFFVQRGHLMIELLKNLCC